MRYPIGFLTPDEDGQHRPSYKAERTYKAAERSFHTEKIIGGKEAEDGISGRFCVKKWVENQQIHREAAELEWEVPQVVVPIIHDEGQE